MKPSEGAGFKRRHGIRLVVAETPGELIAAYRLGAEFAPMLQEQIPGGDDSLWTVGSYVDAGGGVPASSAAGSSSRRRRGSARAGSGVAEWDDEAVDGARRLLHALGFHGISQVEYKRDPRDGSLRLMEVNARLWQWHSLAAACGVDLVQMAYRDAIGEPVATRTSRGPGGAGGCRSFATSARAAARTGAPPPLAPLRPPFTEPVFSLRDPDARSPPVAGRTPLVS